MSTPKGRATAVGLLCAVAATVALWSGPLASVSGALHTSGHAAVHQVADSRVQR